MSEVYLAEDTRIPRQVAVKVACMDVDPYPATTQEVMRLFQREMRAVTLLDHPHILPLFDFGEEKINNLIFTYMVMPFRQEGSLAEWLQKRGGTEKLTLNEVAHFVEQAADALQHAHNHNLVHQDVKPSNFLIRSRSDDKVPDLLLADFGIAKVTTASVTVSQSIRGTPAFMAPEQWEGQPQPATDQYALATMAYLLLTGRTPFSGRMEQVMHQHLKNQPQPPSYYNSAIPPTVDAVILHALEKQPDRRFPCIRDFAQAFQHALRSHVNQGSTTIDTSQNGNDQKATSLNTSVPLTPTKRATPNEQPSFAAPQNPASSTTRINSPDAPVSPGPSAFGPALFGKYASGIKKPGWKVAALLGLILLIIISSMSIFTNYQGRVAQDNATATANAATYTSNANAATSTADANDATSTTVANDATSTAVANDNNATATATVQAYPSYLAQNSEPNGNFNFADSLSEKNHWHEVLFNSGKCQFGNEAYIITSQAGVNVCHADKNVDDFAFEVQLTIVQGDCGGITFRDDENGGKGYLYRICQDGSYDLMRYDSNSGSDEHTLLHGDNNPHIKTGLNTIDITAISSTITLYANQYKIDIRQDDNYSQGAIGLIASPKQQTTEVIYNNARVWSF